MKRLSTSMFLLSAAALIALLFFGAQRQVRTAFAGPSFASNNPTFSPTYNCADPAVTPLAHNAICMSQLILGGIR
jgi:hypothetical protein